MTHVAMQFGFGACLDIDGRGETELWITAETGNTLTELITGRFTWGFGWEPVVVVVDEPGGEALPLRVLGPHLAALEQRAVDAAVYAAVEQSAAEVAP